MSMAMSLTRRFTVLAVLGALTLALAPAARAQSASKSVPTSESANPIEDQGSRYTYRSYITGIAPNTRGLNVQVLEFADRLQLINRSGQTVIVYGYEGEPYARVWGNGAVEVNTRSPAYYLNQNFYGQVSVPASASVHATPHWSLLDRTGRFEWHDHRIHWMSPVPPVQVKDKSRRTKIFDWQVPVRVGGRPGAVAGQLFWVPEEGAKTPVGAIVALMAIVLCGLLLVLFVRRRRRSDGLVTGAGAGEIEGDSRERSREAW
jgi:hypothetical protein